MNQTTIEGHNRDAVDDDRWGDDVSTKQNNTIRIVSQNVGGLHQFKEHYKQHQLVSIFNNLDADIMLLSELNLFWPNVSVFDSWKERMREIKGTRKTIYAYNRTESQNGTHQYGGTAIIVKGDVVHRITETGKDTTGLGRWVWMTIQGRQNQRTRVVSVYRPGEGSHTGSVSEQHRRFFEQEGNQNKPVDNFDNDLQELLIRWLSNGDNVIVGGDFNDDVRKAPFAQQLIEIGLRDNITQQHGFSGPATQQSNLMRKPIDGIFSNADLKAARSGYLSFGEGVTSDHRAVWIDVNHLELYNINMDPYKRLPPRRLISSNYEMVDKYNELLVKYHQSLGLFNDMHQLMMAPEWSSQLENSYNKLLHLSNTIRIIAEKQCRKLRMGNVEWSPLIQSIRDKITLWINVIKRRKGGRVCRKYLARLERRAQVFDTNKLTLNESCKQLSLCFIQYKESKKADKEHRDQFLVTLSEQRAHRKETKPESELKQMKQVMHQRRLSNTIRACRPDKQRTSTIRVFKTDTNGNRIDCISKTEVEDACIEENKQRFTQNHDTPFLTEPLLGEIGLLAEKAGADEILEGTYKIPNGVDKYTRLLIQELRRPDGVSPEGDLDQFISCEDNQRAWKNQKETIASQGLHFGHFKSSAKHDSMNTLDAALRTLPYRHGFSPRAWQRITDVEILKKAGVYDIEKMRTIQLLDAQFNMNNKKLGKEVMKNAERKQLIADEQYGSRKHRRAVTAALNKRLTYDLLRQKRKCGALIVNDAKACYDRVTHNVGILAMRRMGAPKHAVQSMFKTLQLAKHKVRTAFGTSTKAYTSDFIPLQGIAQGNGCAPTGWVCISTPLINILKTAGFGALFLTAISATIIRFVCYAFVDDTDLVHTARSNDFMGHTLIPEVQAALDHWEGGLRSTGGAIVPRKSFWVLVESIWTGKTWRLATISETPGQISVRTEDGQTRKILRRAHPNIGEETLGIFIAADGNESKEMESLREKTDFFSEWLRKSSLKPAEAKHAVNSIIMKTLEYPMEAICLSEDSWRHIMAPVLRACLPKMKVCRNFPRDVVYGPERLQGLGLKNPYTLQQLHHIRALVQESGTGSLTDNLLRGTVEQLRLETGFGEHLTSIPDALLSISTAKTWILSTIRFMKDQKMILNDDWNRIPLNRHGDNYLMVEFLRAGYKSRDLEVLNHCRLFCRVVRVSDVVTGDGQYLRRGIYNLRRDPITNDEFDWPRDVPQIPTPWLKLWQQALILITDAVLIGTSAKIARPLGRWTHEDDKSWKLWKEHNNLYLWDGIRWKVFRPTRSRRTSKFIFDHYTSRQPSRDAERATGEINGTSINLTGTIEGGYQASNPQDFWGLRRLLPSSLKWAISQLSFPNDMEDLLESIRNGAAIAVSDGSFKLGMGTSAFSCGSTRSKFVGVNQVPGALRYHSPYRAELAGVAGILVSLKLLCQAHNIKQGTVTIGLDGKSVLEKLQGHDQDGCASSDYDMLCHIRHLCNSLPITIIWHWVEGHQDDHKQWDELDTWAQWNVMMDSLAKSFWEYCSTTTLHPYLGKLWGEFCSIQWNGRKLTNFKVQQVYDEYYGDVTGDYWIDKGQLKKDTVHHVNWQLLATSTNQLPFQRRVWLSQFLTGMIGVQKWLYRWRREPSDQCPICLDAEESAKHVLRCTDPRVTIQWELSLSRFEWQLEKLQTPPEITKAIIYHLKKWRRPQTSTQQCDVRLQSVIQEQSRIGWENFLYGRTSHLWVTTHQHIMGYDEPYKSKRWVSALIRKAINVAWDFWDHRNNIKYEDQHPWNMEERQKLRTSILRQFQMGRTDLLPEDRSRLRSLEQILALPQDQQTLWVQSMEAARNRWTNQHRHRNEDSPSVARMRASFRAWLTQE